MLAFPRKWHRWWNPYWSIDGHLERIFSPFEVVVPHHKRVHSPAIILCQSRLRFKQKAVLGFVVGFPQTNRIFKLQTVFRDIASQTIHTRSRLGIWRQLDLDLRFALCIRCRQIDWRRRNHRRSFRCCFPRTEIDFHGFAPSNDDYLTVQLGGFRFTKQFTNPLVSLFTYTKEAYRTSQTKQNSHREQTNGTNTSLSFRWIRASSASPR